MLYMERNSCLIREHVSEVAHVDKWIIKAKLARYWPVLCFSTLGSWPHLGSHGIQIGSPGISDENIFLQLIIIITTVFFQEYESSSNKYAGYENIWAGAHLEWWLRSLDCSREQQLNQMERFLCPPGTINTVPQEERRNRHQKDRASSGVARILWRHNGVESQRNAGNMPGEWIHRQGFESWFAWVM